MTKDDEIEDVEPEAEREGLDPAALDKIESTSGSGAPGKILLCTKGVTLSKIVEMSK